MASSFYGDSRLALTPGVAAVVAVAALCLLSSGCATTSDATAQAERVARIAIDANGAPVVHASVDGQDALLVIDSGASYHLIDAGFARRLKLYTIDVNSAVDAGGRKFPLSISESTKVRLGAWQVVHDGVGVADMPPDARRGGLTGILSPQWIDSGHGTIVLDLPALELRWMTDDVARQRFTGRTTTPVERCEGLYSVRLGVRALVDGVRTLLEVDTGRPISTFDPARPLGRRLAADADGTVAELMGLGGPIHGRLVKPTAIGIGDARVSVRPMLVERPQLAAVDECGYEGVIGSDVLRHCVLVFAHGHASLVCTTPPAVSP